MKMRITKKVIEEVEIPDEVYQKLNTLLWDCPQKVSRKEFNKELSTALNINLENVLEICNENEGIFYEE